MAIGPILSSLRRHRTAALLIVLEIALSCAILCNALFVVSQRVEALHRPSGIAEEQLLKVRVAGVGEQTDADARSREDLAALRNIPGVVNASVVNQVPFQYVSWNTSLFNTPDQKVPTLSAAQYTFAPNALETLGLRLLAGRNFNADEYKPGSEVQHHVDAAYLSGPTIVTAATARKLFPGEEPAATLGKTVYTGNLPMTIVGVVERLTRPNGYIEWDFSILFPWTANYDNGGFYLIRVAEPARRGEILSAAVAALEKIDPNRLVLEQKTYSETRNEFFASDRDMIGLLIAVSVLLLAVTALGIVGLASFWVQQRTKQIGIRRALGATRAQIQRYYQAENFLLATAGIVLGMALAYGINQLLMRHYELPRLPLLYLPIGAIALWLLGQLAVLGPARRAAAVPPATATRST